jgi:benzoate membrane transport protein
VTATARTESLWTPVLAGLVTAVVGSPLLSSLVASLQQSVADADMRIPAVVTVVVATSGLTVAGIGSAFWALVAGCLLALLFRRRA